MTLGKPAVFFSQRLNNRFFRGVRNGTVVEAGALDGMTNSVGWWFEKNLGWSVFNIEPNSTSFALCEVSRPDCVNVHAALSNEVGIATLKVPSKPGHGTIEGIKLSGKITTEEIPTITWNNFVCSHRVDSVDLFVLDVEGHELAVVEGMQETSIWPRVICAETNKTSTSELAASLTGYNIAGGDSINTYFVREA